MEVKTWKPAPGCAECARAAKMFDEHTSMAMAMNGKYLAKVKELHAENERLRKSLAELHEATHAEVGSRYSGRLDHALTQASILIDPDEWERLVGITKR